MAKLEVSNEPLFIQGGLSVDDRGVVSFCNDFTFEGVKRWYVLSNHQVGYVRAWHGHKTEVKYVTVTRGAALVCCTPLDSFTKKEGEKVHVYRFVLSDRQPGVLYIPAGYANGHMALTVPCDVVHFSTFGLDETKGDDLRFSAQTIQGAWDIRER